LIDTVAFGTTAAVGSVTVPLMLPVEMVVCALKDRGAHRKTMRAANPEKQRKLLVRREIPVFVTQSSLRLLILANGSSGAAS